MTQQVILDRTFDLGVFDPSFSPIGRTEVQETTALSFIAFESLAYSRVGYAKTIANLTVSSYYLIDIG